MKVMRLYKQKKLWFKKIICAIQRGINNIKELKKVEKEEAAREASCLTAATPKSISRRLSTKDQLGLGFIAIQDAIYKDIPLDLSLLAAFSIIKETPLAFISNA